MVSSTSPLFVALTPCNGAELRAGLNFKCFSHIAALMLRRADILHQGPHNCGAQKIHYYYYFSKPTSSPGEGQKYIDALIEHGHRTLSLMVYIVNNRDIFRFVQSYFMARVQATYVVSSHWPTFDHQRLTD